MPVSCARVLILLTVLAGGNASALQVPIECVDPSGAALPGCSVLYQGPYGDPGWIGTPRLASVDAGATLSLCWNANLPPYTVYGCRSFAVTADTTYDIDGFAETLATTPGALGVRIVVGVPAANVAVQVEAVDESGAPFPGAHVIYPWQRVGQVTWWHPAPSLASVPEGAPMQVCYDARSGPYEIYGCVDLAAEPGHTWTVDGFTNVVTETETPGVTKVVVILGIPPANLGVTVESFLDGAPFGGTVIYPWQRVGQVTWWHNTPSIANVPAGYALNVCWNGDIDTFHITSCQTFTIAEGTTWTVDATTAAFSAAATPGVTKIQIHYHLPTGNLSIPVTSEDENGAPFAGNVLFPNQNVGQPSWWIDTPRIISVPEGHHLTMCYTGRITPFELYGCVDFDVHYGKTWVIQAFEQTWTALDTPGVTAVRVAYRIPPGRVSVHVEAVDEHGAPLDGPHVIYSWQRVGQVTHWHRTPSVASVQAGANLDVCYTGPLGPYTLYGCVTVPGIDGKSYTVDAFSNQVVAEDASGESRIRLVFVIPPENVGVPVHVEDGSGAPFAGAHVLFPWERVGQVTWWHPAPSIASIPLGETLSLCWDTHGYGGLQIYGCRDLLVEADVSYLIDGFSEEVVELDTPGSHEVRIVSVPPAGNLNVPVRVVGAAGNDLPGFQVIYPWQRVGQVTWWHPAPSIANVAPGQYLEVGWLGSADGVSYQRYVHIPAVTPGTTYEVSAESGRYMETSTPGTTEVLIRPGIDFCQPALSCSATSVECASTAGTSAAPAYQITEACDGVTVSGGGAVTRAYGSHVQTVTATTAGGDSASCEAVIDVVDTRAPAITCPPNATLQCTGTPVSTNPLAPASAVDACQGPVATTSNWSGPMSGAGTRTVTYSATDVASGKSASCSAQVRVLDTVAPAVSCTPSYVESCAPASGRPLSALGLTASATDACDAHAVAVTPSQTWLYAGFTQSLVWRARDATGNTGTCVTSVRLDAAQPATLVQHTVPQFWPPNHAWLTVDMLSCVEEVVDACDPSLTPAEVVASPWFRIAWVASDEPPPARGTAAWQPDIVKVDDRTVQLRADRTMNGDGRTYHVGLSYRNPSGSWSWHVCHYGVPPTAKTMAVDSGVAWETWY